MKNKKTELRLDSEGRGLLLDFLSQFVINGWIKDIKVRHYKMRDKDHGVVTYGIKLSGFSGGNIDIEVPIAFDRITGELSKPIVGYIDGSAVILGQGLFNEIFDKINLKRRFYPGWMDLNKFTDSKEFFEYNNWDKYRVSSKQEFGRAFSDFLICSEASKDLVLRAMEKSVMFSEKLGRQELVTNLFLRYGSRLSLHEIIGRLNKIAQDEDEDYLYGEVPPGINLEDIEEEEDEGALEEYIPEEKIEPEDEEDEGVLEEYTPYEEDEGVMEEYIPEKKPELVVEKEPEEKLIIVPPEEPRKIVFPEVSELLEIIKMYRVMRFTYRKLNDEWTTRTVEPHYLWITGKGNILMIAWDYLRGGWRGFDIGRVRDVEIKNSGEWLELGEFLDYTDAARDSGGEPSYNEKDVFDPRGPYSETLQTIRGSLRHMRNKFGGPLRDLVDKMEEQLEGVI